MAEKAISWVTLGSGTPIVTSDGTELGRVSEVIADRQKDIFSGVTFSDGILSGDLFVPADLIEAITTEQVRLSATAGEVKDRLEPYEA